MKFSLLIAHYNNYHYFIDCYKSIISQTYDNLEVIIVDDCSTDNSFEKVKELIKTDSRFKIYKNEKNMGVGYTKNRCVELATGDICGFLDPDDALTKNAIALSIKEYQDTNIVATYSLFYICDENLIPKKIFPNTIQIKNENPYFLNINWEVAHFFTFKKDIYLKTEGIVKEYKVAEDQDIYLKLYEKGHFKLIAEPLLFYRVHKKGVSHDQEKINLKHSTWHTVLKNTLERRNISRIYGKRLEEIENLPKFILQNNTLKKRLKHGFMDIINRIKSHIFTPDMRGGVVSLISSKKRGYVVNNFII